MGSSYSDRHVFTSPVVDFNTNQAALALFAPAQRIVVHKIGIHQSGATQTGTTSCVFARRVGASTDTTIATVVTLASTVGKLLYKAPTSANVIDPGDVIIATSTKTGTSTPGQVVMEYSFLDNAVSENANEVLSA